jgi:hypothetical protein
VVILANYTKEQLKGKQKSELIELVLHLQEKIEHLKYENKKNFTKERVKKHSKTLKKLKDYEGL